MQKFKFKIIILFVLSMIFTQFAFANVSIIEIPKTKPITVDGKMNVAEWNEALAQNFKNGGSLKLSHDGEFLQIGVQGGIAGLSHVYLMKGNDVYVLHASASLGMAVYHLEGEKWQPFQKFNWELRDQATNNEASSAYLKTNDWLGSVTSTPSIEREYKIGMKYRDGEIFRLAVVYLGNPMSPQLFPDTLADDTLKRELLFGREPIGLSFKKEQWATLKLK